MIERPHTDEYFPLVQKYIDLVPSGNIVEQLHYQAQHTNRLIRGLSEKQAEYCYAEGKWSIKTVIGHISDVERLWAYRLLRIARGDSGELSGYDRDIFAEHAACDKLPISILMDDFVAVRQSTISLINTLSQDALFRQAMFNEHLLTARAIPFIIAGHGAHHINVIGLKYLIN